MKKPDEIAAMPMLHVSQPNGVIIVPFSGPKAQTLTAEQQKLIDVHFQSLLPENADQDEKWGLGLLVHVPAGLKIEAPIELTFSTTGTYNVATHILVIIGKGASVTITEQLKSEDRAAEWSHAVELIVEDDAKAEYASLQIAGSNMQPHIQQRSRVGANAKVHWHNTSLGGGVLQHDLKSSIIGDGATSSVDWIFYARGSEKQRISAINSFQGRNGAGEITMKGVAEEKGHTVCYGMIEIGLGGAGTDTYLTEEVLMLDASSKVDAIPGLEIKTNDVKASHSATVSRVTEEDLFYFAARGIDSGTARRMYIEGFLDDLTGRIGDVGLREVVVGEIRGKYERKAGRGEK